jgi:hypothetical protein
VLADDGGPARGLDGARTGDKSRSRAFANQRREIREPPSHKQKGRSEFAAALSMVHLNKEGWPEASGHPWSDDMPLLALVLAGRGSVVP